MDIICVNGTLMSAGSGIGTACPHSLPPCGESTSPTTKSSSSAASIRISLAKEEAVFSVPPLLEVTGSWLLEGEDAEGLATSLAMTGRRLLSRLAAVCTPEMLSSLATALNLPLRSWGRKTFSPFSAKHLRYLGEKLDALYYAMNKFPI